MFSTSSYRDEPSTDASLLQRAREGHEEGWQRLVHVYGPLIYQWVRGCGVQSADAADVMQETLTAVARALPQFDSSGQGATFRGWLWIIARNKLRDRQRRADQALLVPPDDPLFATFVESDRSDPPTDPLNDQATVWRRTLDCLKDQFAPRAWQMFCRTEIDGVEPADVAEELGVSTWAVYKARARVLQRLRRELDGML